MPSVLWCCWLRIRKSIRPVKIELWSVDVVICLERGANCLRVVQLTPLHPKTPLSLAWFKSRLVLPFWYRFTQVVLEKRPLKGCSVVYYYMLRHFQEYMSTLLHCAKVLWQNVCWQLYENALFCKQPIMLLWRLCEKAGATAAVGLHSYSVIGYYTGCVEVTCGIESQWINRISPSPYQFFSC